MADLPRPAGGAAARVEWQGRRYHVWAETPTWRRVMRVDRGNPFLGSLGARVRQLRVDRGLSAEDLGRKLGLSARSVGLLEAGRRAVAEPDLAPLARAFGVSVERLLEGCSTRRETVTRFVELGYVSDGEVAVRQPDGGALVAIASQLFGPNPARQASGAERAKAIKRALARGEAP
jgi:transcriptional regulator with XRE-family HTH domain